MTYPTNIEELKMLDQLPDHPIRRVAQAIVEAVEKGNGGKNPVGPDEWMAWTNEAAAAINAMKGKK